MSSASFPILSSSLPSKQPRPERQQSPSSTSTTFSRRGALIFSLLSFLRPLPAAAFSLGICTLLSPSLLYSLLVVIYPWLVEKHSYSLLSSRQCAAGPKDWLKEQKRKASKFLLAPIDASRRSLRAAYLLLGDDDAEAPSLPDVDQVQELVRAAARDCVPEERNFFVEFQSQTGVEVCTFSLLVKNAASLLDTTSPVKLEAESRLSDLVRSFVSLIRVAKGYDLQIVSSRKKVGNALMDTVSSLDKFEEAIQNCLI